MSSSESYSILIVDDEVSLLRNLSIILRGHRVFLATGAEEAFGILAEEEIDVVVCDVNMPDVTGYQLLREFKRFRSNLPVILISGGEDVEMEMFVNGLALGAISCLTKPFNAAELKAELEFAMRGRGRRAA